MTCQLYVLYVFIGMGIESCLIGIINNAPRKTFFSIFICFAGGVCGGRVGQRREKEEGKMKEEQEEGYRVEQRKGVERRRRGRIGIVIYPSLMKRHPAITGYLLPSPFYPLPPIFYLLSSPFYLLLILISYVVKD